jgi:hypothetical protein
MGNEVGEGARVGAGEAVCATVGLGADPQPARNSEINITIFRVRGIVISKTFWSFYTTIF